MRLPEWALNPVTRLFQEERDRGRLETNRRRGGQDWSDTNKVHLNPPEAIRDRKHNLPQGLPRKCFPADSLLMDFWPLEL